MGFKAIQNLIKKLDLFAQPVSLLTSSGDFKVESTNKKYIYKYGTITGFVFTFGLLIFGLIYLYTAFHKMFLARDDKYTMQIMVNDFGGDYGEL